MLWWVFAGILLVGLVAAWNSGDKQGDLRPESAQGWPIPSPTPPPQP